MHLKELREEIDKIDDELVHLFDARMKIAARIAEYKQVNNLPVLDSSREQEKLQELSEKAGPEMSYYIRSLYAAIFELSRNYQNSLLNREFDLENGQINESHTL